ncbi:collagen-binding protein [Bifidobacterium dolichotidis]|uniref:Collagen-binding protein n=1 Tax=Bifidobacterium dolichotidis TaxID=2306976 RepID=A0A430FRK8_9BIFI|nr:SpaA isopeptide-forming pilin-related protein [Bifidobacterium dolichotidis]RSX55512.1 collagen-binding protein [Bifidobacterium dolichotidis]
MHMNTASPLTETNRHKHIFSIFTAIIGALSFVLAMVTSGAVANTANAAELTDNIVTSATVADSSDSGTKIYSLKMNFSLPNNVHDGDTATISLPKSFVFSQNETFNVYDASGKNIVATASMDASSRTMTLTFTKYVDSHSDITGSIQAYFEQNGKVDQSPYTVVLNVNGHPVTAAGTITPSVRYANPDEVISKVGSFQNANTLSYSLRVNASGHDFGDLTVTDTLKSPGATYNQGSFSIFQPTFTYDKASNTYVMSSLATAPMPFVNPTFNASDNSFTINFPNNGTKGYYIIYTVNLNHNALDNEAVTNDASVVSKDLNKGLSSRVVYQNASGQANGYNYEIQLEKSGPDGQKLAGAQYNVVRDSTGASVGTITTNADGVGSVSGLLRDNYTITETKAPQGYLLNTTPIHVTAADFDNANKSFTVKATDQPVLYTIALHKTGKDDAPLAGATFTVSNAQGVKMGTITTDKDGNGQLAKLPAGDYTLTETKAPAGYQVAAPVTVKASDLANAQNNVYSVTVQDQPVLYTIALHKTGKDDAPLAGATFTVSNAQGVKMGTITTDKDGNGQLAKLLLVITR